MISLTITPDADITLEVNHSNDEPLVVELVIRRERCAAVRVPLPWKVAEILSAHLNLGVAAEMAEEAEDGDEDEDEEAGDGE